MIQSAGSQEIGIGFRNSLAEFDSYGRSIRGTCLLGVGGRAVSLLHNTDDANQSGSEKGQCETIEGSEVVTCQRISKAS